MKVVLFAGGRGLRMRDGGPEVPKPVALVAGRPLLWHVMRWYADHGHRDFVLCLGHRAAEVEAVVRRHAADDWHVTCVDTGLDTPIGERLLRVGDHVADEPLFLANYADVLSDVPLPEVVARFSASDAVAGVVAVRPQATFHLLDLAPGGRVEAVVPVAQSPLWQNGGFFTLRPSVLDVLRPGEELVEEPFARLAATGQLLAHPWEGFWAPVDTPKDRLRVEALLAGGAPAPWVPQQRPTPRLVRAAGPAVA